MGKSKIIHQWKEPKEIKHHSSNIIIKMGKDFVPRVLLIIAVILVLLFLFLSNIVPEEILPALKRGFILTFLAAVLFCLPHFIYPISSRFFGTKYDISEKKIIKSDIYGTKVVLWKNVTGYSMSEDEQFPHLVLITGHTKDKKIFLWLPKGELSEQVVATFNERCSLIADTEDGRPIKTILTDSEYLYLFALSLVYSIVVAYLVYLYRSKFLLGFTLLMTIVFGPGTLGCLFLYGMKALKEKTVRAYALIFNFAGLAFFMLCFILFEFYHWSKIIKELD